jgi:hypothetical protein
MRSNAMPVSSAEPLGRLPRSRYSSISWFPAAPEAQMNAQAINSQDVYEYFMENLVKNPFFWIVVVGVLLLILRAFFGKN